MRLLILTVFAFSGSTAGAYTPCGNFKSLGFEMSRCEDNAEVGEAGLACVRAYRDRVKSAQATVLEKFQAEIERMKREQSDTFNRTQSGYENARRTLKQLIEEGKVARASIDSLEANLWLPADADDEAHTGMSTEQYLATEECYATPKRVLGQSKEMIDHMRTQLEQLEQLALGKQNHSGRRSVNVQALDPPKKAANTVGQGAGKAPAGRQPAQRSDITGTKKAIDDAKKGGAKAQEPPK